MYTQDKTKSSDREQEADENDNEGVINGPIDGIALAYLIVEASKSEIVIDLLYWGLEWLTNIG
jgi:hypothetical protein